MIICRKSLKLDGRTLTPIIKVYVFIIVGVNVCVSVCLWVYVGDQIDKLLPHGYEAWREERGDPLRSSQPWFHHEICMDRVICEITYQPEAETQLPPCFPVTEGRKL